jgi:hypothetical protein
MALRRPACTDSRPFWHRENQGRGILTFSLKREGDTTCYSFTELVENFAMSKETEP